jgi:hypothetical protein
MSYLHIWILIAGSGVVGFTLGAMFVFLTQREFFGAVLLLLIAMFETSVVIRLLAQMGVLQ